MPEFQVIKCFSCRAFQVQQAKKSNKFACVRCGAKQTLQKVYAVSTNAKDCRAVCAKLNMAVGEAEEEMLAAKAMQDLTGAAPAARQQQQQQQQGQGQQRPAAVPSWEQFMEGCEDEDAEDAMGSVPGQQGGGGGDGRFVTEVADGRLKRQGGARRKAAGSIDDGSDAGGTSGEGAAACFSGRAGYGAAPPAPSAAGRAAYHAAPTAPPAARCAGYGAARSALPAAGRAGYRAAPTAPPAAAASAYGGTYKALDSSESAAQHARPCKQPRTGATPAAPFEGQQTYQLAHRQPPPQQPQQHLQQQQQHQQYPGQLCNISAQEQHLRPFQQQYGRQHQALQPWQHKWQQQQQQQQQVHMPAPNGHAPAARAHGTVPMHVGHAAWGTEPQQPQHGGSLAHTWDDTQRAPDQGTANAGQGSAMGNQGAAKGASWGTSPAANSAHMAGTAKPSQNARVGTAASKGALHKAAAAAAPSAKWGSFVDEVEEDVPECVGDGLYVT